jgi:hypothetical protein
MTVISYRRHRFPPSIIQHAIWLYLRFTLELSGRGGSPGRAWAGHFLRNGAALGAEIWPFAPCGNSEPTQPLSGRGLS